MASEGASCAAGELEQQQPPPQLPPPAPIQTLATTVLGSVDAKCEFNMDNLSKPELLTLLSIMEGELEARDLVIEALRARRKEVFLQERYGQYNLTDPFLALQRDYEGGGPLGGPDKDRRGVGPSPMAVLEAVMAHCRKMQERMAAQLAAAERREKRLELEKLQLQSLETEHRKLTAQLKDEREKNKHIVMMLVRECKQLATRVVEESGRFDELQARLDAESRASGGLREELGAERQRSQQMEAKMEKQLSEFDTEREQLRARLGREEAESQSLRRQVERLRTESSDAAAAAATTATPQPAGSAAGGAEPAGAKPTPSAAAKPLVVSVAVQATEPSPVSSRTCQTSSRSCQTDSPPVSAEVAEGGGGGGGRKTPQTPVKPAPANYVGLSLPKTPGRAPQTENGSEGQPLHGAPSGVSPRVQAARYKFQEQDQNGTANQSPPGSARDLSPTNRDNFAAKQQARHTVTQVLSRFTSPPAGGGSGGSLRPGLPHSASEGGPFPLGRLSHPIGLKSPTVARIDRGNPPPIPPKKPGLSQTPSAPHPPIKMAGEGGRSGKAATPQLPPKPSLDLVPALTSQVGAGAAAACAECPLLPTISPPIINPSPSSPTASSSPSSSASAPSSRSSRAPAGIPLATASGWCTSVVVLPLDAGGGPAAALDSGRPPLLLQAASQGNVTLLSMLLNQPDPTTDTTTTTTTTDTTMTTDHNDEDSTTVDNNTPSHHNHQQQQQLHVHQTSALFAAARNGYTDCVRLLLNSGVSTDVLDENGFTPLHFASTYGHCGCVEVLLASGADVDHRGASSGHQTALHMASDAGSLDCVRALLNGGADRAHTTADGCTALHAAVRSGHVDTLRLLLCHPVPGVTSDPMTSDPVAHPAPLALPAALLNQANAEGWTAAHMAAARGFKECLEVLFSHSEQDIDRRDKCNRTVHDVATDDCKDLLENLDSYRVQVCVQLSSPTEGGGGEGGVVVEPMCLLQEEEEEEEGGASGRRTGRRWAVLGRVCVERSTRWSALSLALGHAFTSHLQLLCCRDHSPSPSYPSPSAPPALLAGRDDSGPSSLGLGPASIASVLIGDTAWLPGQELPLSPWDLVRKPLSQRIMLRLKGLSESCLDELAVDSLFPLPLLHNYVRLVEQYGNLIFHGLEGSCQEYIANQIARCIKAKQEVGGVCCDVVRVEVDESLTKEQLLETFITCGFLVPAVGVVSGVRGHSVVVLLEGLEKASSLPGLLGDLCHSLDNRGAACPLALPTGPHYFREGCFLIGTLSKTRLQGSELRLQQHFRWVTLRWDQEPLHGLLGRHLRRKLLHKTGAGVWCWDGALERSALWVSRVWQQLNACLSRLGTHEALLGPRLFLSCPVVPHNTQAVVKWLVRLWNAVVVPRVEEAIVSRVTAKRPSPSSSSPSSPSPAPRRASSGSHGLTSGQQAVVKAALSILVNKAVLLGCPLPRHEIDRHLLEFQGGSFPMSAIGSCKGSSTAGGRKGRDSGQWRRANTSPRKKGSPASSNWSCGGPLREGSLSTTDVRFTNGDSQRLAVGEPTGLSVFSDDETDLIRELTSMCSSKSEPDISKMAQSKDDLDVVYSSADPHRPDQEGSPQPRTQTPSSSSSSRPSSRGPASSPSPASERRGQAPGGRPTKSQLPVPSSRGQQQQPRASSSSSSTSGVSGSSTGSQTPLSNRTAVSRTESSSKTRPVPSGSNLHLHQQHHRNNNIVNGNSQPTHHEDIWVLHRDLHQNSINNNK